MPGFDLHCRADPGLDPGNFLGHMTEQALRLWGDPAALRQPEEALEERFIELSGEAVRPSLRPYAALTVGRHVYLSRRSPEPRALPAELVSPPPDPLYQRPLPRDCVLCC